MTSTTNPLLLGHGLPSYGRFTPDAIGAGMPELLRQLEGALAHHEARLVTLDDPTWEQVMDPLHHIEERLRWAWGVVNHLMGVCDSDALRQVHRQQQPAVVRFYNRLGQSGPLYKALQQLQQRHQKGLLPLDGVQQRILTAAVQAMELQGVGLEPERRQAFNTASTRLAELSTRYSNHVLDATKAWSLLLNDPQQVDGLPGSLRELMAAAAREAGHRGATAAAGPWQLGLDLPRYGPFLRYSRQQHLREQAYRAYVGRASAGDTDNHPLIHEILTLRHQQAQRLGYNTWAQVSLVSKMAGSVEDIQRLVEELRRASRPAAALELEQLGRLAKEMGAPQGERLKPWDVSYWSEQLRRRRFDLDSEALRPWFPLEQVLKGLFGLCERLFDIRILAADQEAPTWHRDVRFFQVVDQEQNTPIAAFYLDPYARPGQKRGGAWMDECLVRQRDQDGRLVHPVAYLICNQTPPVNDTPSLMTFMEVRTLFHEFGHGLQHMLTTINRPQAAGLNLVEDDAIELASQFMENWCYDQPTIMAMARHWQTGAPLPEAEFQKIRAARTFMAGTAMLRQLSFAQGDLELHDHWQPDSEEAPEATWRRIATAMAVLPPIAEDATICSFEHLFAEGYDAGYYAYKWSEVLSADAFSAFEAVGLENEAAIRTLGKRYRDTVLSLGGSQHAGKVFRAFRGREPSTEALLRHSGLVGEKDSPEKPRQRENPEMGPQKAPTPQMIRTSLWGVIELLLNLTGKLWKDGLQPFLYKTMPKIIGFILPKAINLLWGVIKYIVPAVGNLLMRNPIKSIVSVVVLGIAWSFYALFHTFIGYIYRIIHTFRDRVASIGHGIAHIHGMMGSRVRALGHGVAGIGHGLSHGASAVAHGLGAGTRALGHGVAGIGHGLSHGASAVAHGLGAGARALGHGVVGIGHGLAHGASAVAHGLGAGTRALGHGVAGIGHGLSHGASTVAHGLGAGTRALGDGAAGIGHGLSHGASAVAHGVSSGILGF